MAGKLEAVSDWMTPDPVWIELEASALQALDLMTEHGIRHLPVVDSSRRVVGVLTLDDLRAGLPLEVNLRATLGPRDRAHAREYAVREIMTWEPICVRPETPLAEAAARLAELRIGCLPVLDEQGRLTGILSETDALTALTALLDRRRLPPPLRKRARLDLLAERLRAERDRVAARLARYEERRRQLAAARREVPEDAVQQAREQTDIDLEGALADFAEHRLRTLDHALGRAAEGRLGSCDRCGGGIALARLRAVPGATLCVRCATAREAWTQP